MDGNSARAGAASAETLLDVRDARIWYATTAGEARVVDGVDVSFHRNEVFGLAGESGCGKSTLVEGLLRLIKQPGYVESGSAVFRREGVAATDLLSIPLGEMRPLRWRDIAYVPQGAMTSLNPVLRVEDQIVDAIMEHQRLARAEARERMRERLEMVGLPPSVARMYPHELSGGMKQRVTIASSVTLNPALLLADEPTTALDVGVQRVILQELKEIRERMGLTIVYVSHDMAVHAEMADRMGIMYAGVMMEVGRTSLIFKDPLHPYTQGLIRSIPDINRPRVRVEGIPGLAPSPLAWPKGCRFHPRCPFARELCAVAEPRLAPLDPRYARQARETEGRHVACHQYTPEWKDAQHG
jgi:peptide/nickel transport system ATP-binding protein